MSSTDDVVASAADAAARKFADATFAMVYGRLAISYPGRVALTDQPLAADPARIAAEVDSKVTLPDSP